MNYISLKISCTREPAKHAKVLRLQGMGLDQAEVYAAMVCGESPYFINPPGPGSPVGRCALCGARLEWNAMEATDDAKPAQSSDRAYRVPAQKPRYHRGRPARGIATSFASGAAAGDAGAPGGQLDDADQPAGGFDDTGRGHAAVLSRGEPAGAAGEPAEVGC